MLKNKFLLKKKKGLNFSKISKQISNGFNIVSKKRILKSNYFLKRTKLFLKKRYFRLMPFRSFFGGVILTKKTNSNYLLETSINNCFFILPHIVFFFLKKAFNLLFYSIRKRANVLLVSNELSLRSFLLNYKYLPFSGRNLQLSYKGWIPGSLSNFRCILDYKLPDLVVSLSSDFDDGILREAFSILRPSIGLVEGKYFLNLADYSILINGSLISHGKALTKLIVDYFFILKRRRKYKRIYNIY